MHVVATAGHVDHGKSTLVRALTGMEPDRWAEERRRGMTIDLGFAWAALGSGEHVAFVDVPGHERFVTNMLAGVGPVPAVMFVVAADEGWMPQSAEHLAALDALGVRHGLLVVTRGDLADPGAALEQARAEIRRTSLGEVEAVAVSGRTGQGLDDLVGALERLVGKLPAARADGAVRLWIDRVFTIRGAGTVVTGTLGSGTIRLGDEFTASPDGERVRVRGLQCLGNDRDEVAGVARVAVNLRGAGRERLSRGDALLTPGRFRFAELIDVRVHGDVAGELPATLTMHLGSAAVDVRIRPLGTDTVRLRLGRPLPLRIGDRGLLRDPGRRRIAGGLTVLDVAPPALNRRGAAAARAADLARMDGRPDLLDELRRRLMITGADLSAMGVDTVGRPVAGDWLLDEEFRRECSLRMREIVGDFRREHPLQPGMPVDAVRRRLGLPDRAVTEALVVPPLVLRDGRVTAGSPDASDELRALIDRAFAGCADFAAPEAHTLQECGIGPRQIAAAARTGLLIPLAPQVVLRPEAPGRAADELRRLPQPFTISQARQALGTTRRVAVPLLELLDQQGVTNRGPDDRRTIGAKSDE